MTVFRHPPAHGPAARVGGTRAGGTRLADASVAGPEDEAVAALPTGAWSPVGDLPFEAFWAQPSDGAALLPGGRVLAAGGEDGRRQPLADTAVFDPATALWSAAAPLGTPRRLHTVTALADGRVLVVGGLGTGPSFPASGLATAELYDPATGIWTRTGDLAEPRYSHSATLLADGRVLVAGGAGVRSAQSGRALRSAELYDPQHGTWSQAAPMTDARFGHPAVRLSDGRVLAVGGVVVVGRGTYAPLGFCELFDPGRGWMPTGTLGTPRKGHQAVLLPDGGVLVCGGDRPGFRYDSWTYDPYSQWETERFDPARGTWTADAGMEWGRSHHRAVRLASGAVLVVGGTDDASFDIGYQNSVGYDPGRRRWDPQTGMHMGRWAPAAVALPDGRALALGGIVLSGAAAPVAGEQVVTATTEVFTPAAGGGA